MKISVNCIVALIAERLDAGIYKEYIVTVPAKGRKNLDRVKASDLVENLEHPAFIVEIKKEKRTTEVDKNALKLGE